VWCRVWIQLHLTPSHPFQYYLTIQKSPRWAKYLELRGEERDLIGKPEENRPFGRPRRRWEDNKSVATAWNGLKWLRTGKSGGLL